jgi:hypothetical protein
MEKTNTYKNLKLAAQKFIFDFNSLENISEFTEESILNQQLETIKKEISESYYNNKITDCEMDELTILLESAFNF